MFERVSCYYCHADDASHLVDANEDLTGKLGTFTFVRCNRCGLAYQNPRVDLAHIGAYYDDEYIAHRKKTQWGVLQPAYDWAMGKYDRDKDKLVRRYVTLDAQSQVLDVGCAVGSFLLALKRRYGCAVAGVDFKDCSYYPGFEAIEFHKGLFYEQDLAPGRFDLITMWHFLEHDYDPMRTLRYARTLLADEGRLIIEVPRFDSVTWRLYRERWPGLQAPQHTVLYDKAMLLNFAREAGFEVVEHLPWGAFPAYFYVFTGALFKVLRGRGIDMDRWVLPYFLGQVATAPVMLFERHLNLAMQTVVLKKGSEGLA
ncbi:MAG: class I SAM-dependent methyltransferase [bacterium]